MNRHVYCWHVMGSLIGNLPLDAIPAAERALAREAKCRLLSIEKLRAIWTGKARTPTYLTLLLETSDCLCTMPVDKMYTLWSLACDAHIFIPYPESTRSGNDRRLWRLHKVLDIALQAPLKSCLSSEPTTMMVADWSQSTTGYKHRLASTAANDASHDTEIRSVGEHKPYCASGSSALAEEMLPVGPYTKILTCYVHYSYEIAFVEELPYMSTGSMEPASVLTRIEVLNGHALEILGDYGSCRKQTLLCDILQASILGRHYMEHKRLTNIIEAHQIPDQVENPILAFAASGIVQHQTSWEPHTDSVLTHRSLVITRKGHFGLAAMDAEIGDAIAIIAGRSIPVIPMILKLGNKRCKVVGENYFQDMMKGQMSHLQ
ncbi:hypothetical protein AC579_7783 [Pseudocercospora musae]|uniref:Heterokaryon incompatibility domain-containing protein n=1 Tax=Pseudocercospora musae TaxID=113226 RepID=A0A139IK66_9PEZI|nr:hypothetical protein AC579_7783 [Pseudocercospora musae]